VQGRRPFLGLKRRRTKPSSNDWRRWPSLCQAEPMRPPTEPAGEEPIDRHNRWKLRHWPPDNQMPAILPTQQILGRSESVTVVLREVVVYTTGLNFYVTARGRPGLHPSFMASVPEIAKRMGIPEASSTPAHIEVIYEDGTTAVDMSSRELLARLDEVADKPVLRDSTGSGKPDSMDYQYWLTPAPTEGITIRFEWPDQGLTQTTFRIDAAELQRAVGQAIELWL